MADTGWLNAGTQTNAANWVNPANSLTEDGTEASIVNPPDNGSSYIRISNFTGIVAALASATSIDGIELRGKVRRTGSIDYSYFFVGHATAGTPQSVSSLNMNTMSTTLDWVTIGGASQLWGGVDTDANGTFNRNWQVSDFDSNFGISGNFVAAAGSVFMDHWQLKVYFTAPLTTRGLMLMGCGT